MSEPGFGAKDPLPVPPIRRGCELRFSLLSLCWNQVWVQRGRRWVPPIMWGLVSRVSLLCFASAPGFGAKGPPLLFPYQAGLRITSLEFAASYLGSGGLIY